MMAQNPLFPSQYNAKNILNLPEYWDSELTRWVKLWIQDLQSGIQPATAQTVRTHRARFIRYTTYIYEQNGQQQQLSIADCLEITNLYGRISSYPVESYSNRHCTFFSLRSFAQYLIKLGQLEEGYLIKIKPFRPKRVVPAKRTVLRDKEMLEKFRGAIQKEHYESDWSYLTVKTIMETLIQTGLRSSELAGLRLEDTDLMSNRLTVYLGKGRKSRVIGIPKSLNPFLERYLEQRLKVANGESFFLNGKQLPLQPVNIARMIQRISKRIELPITAHGLRRTFATLNAEEGRPLHLIQKALGHSNITTTQGYLMSDQEAVIEAMQDW
jgi:integrase/recombinase XerD